MNIIFYVVYNELYIEPGSIILNLLLIIHPDIKSKKKKFLKYKKIIKSVNGKMNHGRDPIEVANLVLKIIKEKKPKINYLVGGFLEKKITLKSLLPDKLFQKIIMKLYS